MSDAPVPFDPTALPDPRRPDAPVRPVPPDPTRRADPLPPGASGQPDPTGELARPLPPRTWRDRLDDLASSAPAPGRVAAAAGALVVAGAIGWRMLAPPAPPPEMAIPFAEQGATDDHAGSPTGGGEGGGGGGEAAWADSSAAASAGAPAGAPGGPAPAGGGIAGEVVVHVVGAVASPGVQRLPAGARLVDAVEAAGGATADADLGRVNLAAPLSDGQQVYVPRVGEQMPQPVPGGGTTGPDGAGGLGGGPVNINTASASQLEELPGVGPTTAEAIIAHRDQHGPFGSVDDLIDVRGIGEAKLEQIRPRATV